MSPVEETNSSSLEVLEAQASRGFVGHLVYGSGVSWQHTGDEPVREFMFLAEPPNDHRHGCPSDWPMVKDSEGTETTFA